MTKTLRTIASFTLLAAVFAAAWAIAIALLALGCNPPPPIGLSEAGSAAPSAQPIQRHWPT